MKLLNLLFVVAATLLTACVQAPASYGDRMDRGRDGGWPGDYRASPAGPVAGVPAGVRVGPPGSYGGPPPRAGADPVPRLPAGMSVFPRQGQSWERARADEQLCVNTSAIEPQSASELGYYERAVAACLEARGYRVR